MRSIYERALGEEFERLHPKVQRRFGFDSDDGVASIGTGTMEVVRNGGWYTLPFLYAGLVHNIMFPEEGTAVPFAIHNYAYTDDYGRETVTWVREFELPRRRRFDATMIYSEERDRIVDYLGSRQHLAVDIDVTVDEDTGGVTIETGRQRLYGLGAGVGFPRTFTGEATVREWFDEDEERFRIHVAVENPLVGTLFEYRGSFTVEWVDCETPPEFVQPSVTRRGE